MYYKILINGKAPRHVRAAGKKIGRRLEPSELDFCLCYCFKQST